MKELGSSSFRRFSLHWRPVSKFAMQSQGKFSGRFALPKLDADARGVSVDDRNACAMRRDDDVLMRNEFSVENFSENLAWFSFAFFFFPLNIGKNIVHDIESGDAGISCSGQCLKCGDDHALDLISRAKKHIDWRQITL